MKVSGDIATIAHSPVSEKGRSKVRIATDALTARMATTIAVMTTAFSIRTTTRSTRISVSSAACRRGGASAEAGS